VFAQVRSHSQKSPVCRGFGWGEQTAANPSERRVQPFAAIVIVGTFGHDLP
jgi:hypothetical protein